MSLADLYLLSPEVGLAAVAAVVLVLDLVMGRRAPLTAVTVLGLAVPAAMSVALWGEVAGWWSLLDAVEGERAGYAIPGVYGALAVDRFALFFKFLIVGSAALVLLASSGTVDSFSQRRGEYHVLLLLSTIGMMLMAGATELITLYVAVELATLPLVALAAFGGTARSSEAGLKFLVLGAISSAVLLYGMALTFGFLGTTSLTTMATVVGGIGADGGGPFASPLLAVGIVLMVAGFGFKIAVVPFQMWVPDVYEGAPTPVAAFLSVASKAAGFAVILRVFSTAFGSLELDWALLFAGIAAASMTLGNLVAIAQTNIKRMLAYSTVAHAGYMLVGLAAVASRTPDGSALGSSVLLFYLGGYAVTNLGAFFAVIAIASRTGTETIAGFAGMGRRAPWVALILTLCLLSLTGIPPTVGFMAKLFVFTAAIKAGLAWLVMLGVANSVISAYYYLRIVRVMYASAPDEAVDRVTPPAPLGLALAATAFAVLVLGIWPHPLLRMADRAVQQIFN
jgi:NADH-quinone oxidoreductase subunit N